MSKGHVAMVSGWQVTVLSWTAIQGPEEKEVVWALQSNLCQQAGLFTIFAKSLIAWEKNSHSSTHGTHPSKRSQRTLAREPYKEDNVGLAAAHMLFPPGAALCAHTHVGTLTEEPCSSHEHRFIDRNTPKLVRKKTRYRSGLHSYFCSATISFPHKIVWIPFFLHIK